MRGGQLYWAFRFSKDSMYRPIDQEGYQKQFWQFLRAAMFLVSKVVAENLFLKIRHFFIEFFSPERSKPPFLISNVKMAFIFRRNWNSINVDEYFENRHFAATIATCQLLLSKIGGKTAKARLFCLTIIGNDILERATQYKHFMCYFSKCLTTPGNTKGGSIAVPLTSCLTGLD